MKTEEEETKEPDEGGHQSGHGHHHHGHHHHHHNAADDSIIRRPRESPWPAVSMAEAFDLIEKHIISGTCKFIRVNLAKPGYVLVNDLVSAVAIPTVNTSVKDGYAVIASDTDPLRRVISATVAGDSEPVSVQSGECVRVCTGSVMPRGADAVVMVEYTELTEHDGHEEKVIKILRPVKEGQDVRPPGSDVKIGDLLLKKGTLLGSAEMGILASCMVPEVEVYRKPRVCVMSTGNELVDCALDEPIAPGHICDSNRPQLLAMFNIAGFKAIDAGIAHDDRDSLAEGIRCAFKFANVLVTSGGVSMGEKDLMKDILQKEFGFTIHFGRVWMKPGLPTTFATGEFDGVPRAVFALPGNTVSSWVCAQLFTIPALRRIAGYERCYQTILRVKLARELKLDVRPEYVRASLDPDPDPETGLPIAHHTGNQCSSRLMSVTGASVLLRLPSRTDSVPSLPAGSAVDALVVGNI